MRNTFACSAMNILHAVMNETKTPCSRDAESSERSACVALRSEDSASRLHGRSFGGNLSFVSFSTAWSIVRAVE